MKGLHSVKPNILTELDITEGFDKTIESKVKITKALVTMQDVLHFTGENRVENIVLGSYGIGVISEAGNNLFDLEKGTRVYIEPEKQCGKCFNCKLGETNKCSDIQIAGEDYHGFLRDFATAESSKIFSLPESVSDFEALFIGKISIALSIINSLNIEKGDHIAIIGGTTLGIILAELLIYYQAVPILIDSNKENIEIAKKSGVYYTLSDDEKWIKDVTSITGGRMAKGVVYLTDSNIAVKTAFNVASFKAPIVFSGTSHRNCTFSFLTALKKQLVIMFINNGFSNTASSINLLANKALDFTYLKVNKESYSSIATKFKALAKDVANDEPITDTVVDMLK